MNVHTDINAAVRGMWVRGRHWGPVGNRGDRLAVRSGKRVKGAGRGLAFGAHVRRGYIEAAGLE